MAWAASMLWICSLAPSATEVDRRAMFSIAAPVSCVVADICSDALATRPAVSLIELTMPAMLTRVEL